MKKVFAVGIIAAGLAACGGSGGSSIFSSDDNNQGGLPPERPTSSISGYSVDALITNGVVRAYALDNEANRGELLGSGVTDSKGFYDINLQTKSQPILIEVTGGSYIEEASGVSVSLDSGDVLRAMTFYESGKPLTTMVTPFTNIAAGIVKHKVQTGINLNNAITESVTAMSTITGVDILVTYPRNITDPANATFELTAEHMYGFLTAAQSLLAKDISERNGVPVHTIYTSMGLSRVMYQDVVSDGLLDGKGIGSDGLPTQLALGTVLLNPNMYRNVLGQNLLSIAADESINKTGITPTNLLNYAQTIASNSHAMFGGIEVEPLDQTPPTIAFTQAEGVTKAGVFGFTVSVTDFVAIGSVEFFIDGVSLGIAVDVENPEILINAENYANGSHIIGVVAEDILGNVSAMAELSVDFDNEGITALVTSPLQTNQAAYAITGTWHNDGVGVSSIVVDGKNATFNDDGTWFVTVTLAPGYNDIGIRTTDTLGNTKDTVVTFGLDQAPPSITAMYDSSVIYALDADTIYVDSFKFADTKTYPVRVYTDELSSSGISPCDYDNAGIPNIDFTGVDPYFYGISTGIKSLAYEIRYIRDESVVYDWRPLPPCVEGSTSHAFGLTTEYLDDEWHLFPQGTVHKIEVRVTDEAGNFSEFNHKFRVDVRVPADALTLNSVSTSTALSVASFSSRNSLLNTEVDANKYVVTNDSGHDVYVSFDETNTYSVTNTVEWAERENKYALVTSTEWRTQILESIDFNSDPIATFSDWFFIDSYDYSNASGSGTIYRPADTKGSAIDIQSDILPNIPVPTEWEFKLATDEEPFPGDGSVGIGDYFTVQKRDVFSYINEPGFPKNNTGYSQLSSSSFNSGGIVVTDLFGRELVSVNGYFKLSAGIQYTFARTISTPVVSSYNDTSVANLGSFRSYSRKQLDSAFDWTIGRELSVNLVHAETPEYLYEMFNSNVVYEEGQSDSYSQAR